ncbi:MAG: hypothetical protein U1F37_19355, partial [Alphaproteobacteria bacterium]
MIAAGSRTMFSGNAPPLAMRDTASTIPAAAPNAPARRDAPAAPRRPRVVIVGAGFGGLAAARALRRGPGGVASVDR